MKQSTKSPKNELKATQIKPSLVVFDLDGCIMNSDDFVITKKQAWELSKDDTSTSGYFAIEKPRKSEENDFSLAYLYKHHSEIQPYYGILDMFVKFAVDSNVAIVSSRYEIMHGLTTQWLEEQITKRHGNDCWRRVRYTSYFNKFKESTLKFKKDTLSELMRTYDITLMVEDHPDVINWAKSKNIMVLVPSTGYKNLNGKDLQ